MLNLEGLENDTIVCIPQEGILLDMAGKKQISKKKANEGRGVLCRDCHVPMKQQLTLTPGPDDFDWVCERCGRRWEVRPGR